MQYFKVLVTSITGVKGKLLNEGEVHPETEFTEGHCPELVANKAIAEVSAPSTQPEVIVLTKKYLKEHPELAAEGYKEGDQYPKPVEA